MQQLSNFATYWASVLGFLIVGNGAYGATGQIFTLEKDFALFVFHGCQEGVPDEFG
jgi:hypothetical protein